MERLVDLKSYLQKEIDKIQSGFTFFDERLLCANTYDNAVIVSQLAGSSSKFSASQSYQLEIYTSDIDNAKLVFEKFATTHSRTSFESTYQDENGEIHFASITQSYTTPAVMEKDIQYGNNHYARIVVFANLYIVKDVLNIKSLLINNQEIDYDDIQINWVQQSVSNRMSGRNNNKNISELASLSIAIVCQSQNSQFFQQLRFLRMGKIDKATSFEVKIIDNDNYIETYNMLVQSQQFQSPRTSSPTLSFTLVEKEDFADNLSTVESVE